MANITVPDTEPPMLPTADSSDFKEGERQAQINEQERETVQDLLADLLALHGKLVESLSFEAVLADQRASPGKISTSSSAATKSPPKTSARTRSERSAFSPGAEERVDSRLSRSVRDTLSCSQEQQDAAFAADEEVLRYPLQPQLVALANRSMKAVKTWSRSKTRRMPSSPTAVRVIEERASRWILYPSSRFRLCWDALTLLILLQDMLLSPLHVFDGEDDQRGMQNSWIVVSAAFWSLDVVLSFFTAVYVDGRLVQDGVGIAKAYMMSWMPFDLCILVPEPRLETTSSPLFVALWVAPSEDTEEPAEMPNIPP
ncbi:Hcn4 [Symbiodinium sp. CCMP2456]|nr:Hcn4 [Symbiodinium sp. CCMP2456]